MSTLNPPMRVAVLTISDRCSEGTAEDTSGPALVALVQERLHAEVVATGLVPDDRDTIVEQLRTWALYTPKPDLLLTTGGTGLGPRDITPEATLAVLERRHSSLMELARMRCYAITPLTYASRAEAGTLGQTLIVNLPGSRKGAVETCEALVDVLPHCIKTLRG